MGVEDDTFSQFITVLFDTTLFLNVLLCSGVVSGDFEARDADANSSLGPMPMPTTTTLMPMTLTQHHHRRHRHRRHRTRVRARALPQVVSYIKFKHLRRNAFQMVLNLAIADGGLAVALLLRNNVFDSHASLQPGALCTASGIMQTYFELAGPLWTLGTS